MKFDSRRSTVIARNGMVSTSHPLAAISGLRILAEGGNAIDAAVAAAAVLNVVEPMSSGVGGDAFTLVWMAKEKKVRALNASGRSPLTASLDELQTQHLTSIPEQSPYAVTTPGAVSGWETVLDAYGTMPLSEVLKPAIRYAFDGYPVSEIISTFWESNVHKLRTHPSGSELLIDGRAPRPGEVMRIPELANTLQTIAEGGSKAFYHGALAEKIASYVQECGGWLSTEDMANHQATWEVPIHTDYRGIKCWECPPNSQGLTALMALNLAEGFDLKAMGLQSSDTYHHLIECMRLAFADGLYHVTDPRKMKVTTENLTSKGYADRRRGFIRADRAMDSITTGLTPSRGDTVYITSVDREGNACSFINSLYRGFGTGLVVPDTGIALHNRGSSFSLNPAHPNTLEPNKRPFHTLVPGMATNEGELWLSYGVMGAMQQAQGHLQVLVNMIDFGLSPQAALDAPRFSVRVGEGIAIENLVPNTTVRDLEAKGHHMMVLPPQTSIFGGGQIIERDVHTGVLKGGSEPRTDGCAVGW